MKKKSIVYKSIMVPADVHYTLKNLAARYKTTIAELVEQGYELLRENGGLKRKPRLPRS